MKSISGTFVLLACTISALFVHESVSILSYQPEQVHIAFGDNLWEIVVTWNTLNNTNASVVEYGINGLITEEVGNAVPFVNSGPEKRTQFVHSVKLKNLQPGEKYVYHCGSELGWSDIYFFSTPPNDPSWSPRLAVFGDLGLENAQSVPRLQKEAQRGLYDAILHVGDFGYDLHWENGEVGNEFMKKIEPIAAYVPYMTCPGNHEEQSNFSEYRGRFRMPGGPDAMMYSFDMGPVHFVSINTEAYYFLQYGLKEVVKQYNWLIEDLKRASSPANRAIRPWIVVFGHRPMYCSDDDHDDCTQHETRTRVGLPFLRAFGLEPLLHQYAVDLVIWAHEHSYERLWPVFDYKVLNGSYDRPYHNARAPVHVITGSAGCRENVDGFFVPTPGWSAFRSSDYGYTRMHAINGTHLYLEQVSDDKDGAVIDWFWITKDSPTPKFA